MHRLFEGNGVTSARHRDNHGCSADPYASQEIHMNSFEEQVSYLIPSEVRMISGCHSLETSVDLHNLRQVFRDTQCQKGGPLPLSLGRSGGACTSALLSILYNRHQFHHRDHCLHDKNHQAAGEKTTPSPFPLTFQQLLLELRQKLVDAGLSQVPQLTSSRPLDVEETPFSLSPDRCCCRRGTNRALLVGINYYGQNGELSGCINDVKNVKKYLVEHQGYEEQHILCLLDDGSTPHFPTRQKIIRALQQLVAQSVPGDAVYFHYSGHGGLLDKHFFFMPSSPSTPSSSTLASVSKKDYDETLYPVDHSQAGQIRDFNLFHHFVRPMPAGVVVTCVMDSCHSGGVLDLLYSYRPTSSSGGTIRARQSMDQLSHLALLYVLAGGMLPDGMLFEGLRGRIADTAGVASVDELQGIGVEELTYDTEPTLDGGGFGFENGEGNIDSDGLGNMDDADLLLVYGQDDDPSGYDEGAIDFGDIKGMDFGDFGAADGAGDLGNDFVVGGDDDIDCGCVADVLGALLEE